MAALLWVSVTIRLFCYRDANEAAVCHHVGDKSSHEVTFHGAQVLYFIIVAASGFGLSLAAPTYVRAFAASARRNGNSVRGFLFISFLIAATVMIIFCFSPVHKFMLADNRHYTFYVWRKFFQARHGQVCPCTVVPLFGMALPEGTRYGFILWLLVMS